jgi:methylenetetrahydrofolate dehydrogenase (NADP+) / methenyltetrahydrofolate cyclohydrolase
MKLLNGTELVSFIKERQAKQVRALRQADKVIPRLAIIQTIDDPVIDM